MIYFDKKQIEKRAPHELKHFLSLDIVNQDVILAGGALRTIFKDDSKIVDFDLFFKDGLTPAKVSLQLEDLEFKNVFTCPKGELKTFKRDDIKVQLITKTYYRDMEHVISTFDINACCIAYDGTKIVTTRNAIRDIFRKSITLNNVEYPNATFRRILKYKDKGYKVTNKAIDRFVDVIYNNGVEQSAMSRVFYVD